MRVCNTYIIVAPEMLSDLFFLLGFIISTVQRLDSGALKEQKIEVFS